MDAIILPPNFDELECRVGDLYQILPSLVTSRETQRELLCTRCRKLLIRAYRAPCQHHFCGPCLVDMRFKGTYACPVDNASIAMAPIRHQAAEKTIETRVARVEVRCPCNCGATSTVLEILGHLQACSKRQNLDQFQQPMAPSGPNEEDPVHQLSQEIRRMASQWQMSQNAILGSLNDLSARLNQLSMEQKRIVPEVAKRWDAFARNLRDDVGEQNRQLRAEVTNLRNAPATTNSGPWPAPDSGKSSQAGQLQWRIQHFRDAMRSAETRQRPKLRSEEFATETGYRFCVEVYPDGYQDAKGQFASVLLKLLPSGNDDHLEWPLVGRVTFAAVGRHGVARFDKTVPLRLDRSVGKNRSILCVPRFLGLDRIRDEFLGHDADFLHLSVVVEDGPDRG